MTGALQVHPVGMPDSQEAEQVKLADTPPAGSDEAGVMEACRGSHSAYARLMQAYWPPVFRALRRMLHDEDTTQEVCQRAFIRGWESLSSLKNPGRFRSWIFSIALNMGRNELRGRKRAHHVELDKAGLATPAFEVGDDRQLRLQRLQNAIALLPTRQREVVTLRIESELSFREIAECLGGTEGAARVNYCHALKKLKARMESEGANHEE